MSGSRSNGEKFVGLTTKRTLSGELRWTAQATINDAHFNFGTWATAREAAIAFDRAVLHYRGPGARRNFPQRELPPADAKQLQEEARRAAKKAQEIPYDGVQKFGKKHWIAKLKVNGAWRCVGTWTTAEAAAIAYDRAVLKYFGKTAPRNFPERQLKVATVEQLQAEAQQERGVRSRSGYLGVRPRPAGSVFWPATIGVDGQFERLGSWPSAEKAAEAYDRAVLKYRGEQAARNFPKRRLRPADAAQLRAEAYQDFKNCTSSKYRGVSRVARGWCATAGDCFVGVWHSEEKAAKAHDQALLFLGRATEKTNFPARRLAGVSPSELRKEAYRDRKGRSRIHTSRYVGVSYNPANGGRAWNASLTADGKQHNLGYWKNEMDAARVHDRAVLFYKTEGVPLNFPDEGNPPASAATLRAESFREGKARYSSSFRGVHYDKENQCWKASITYRFRSIWLGRFADEREAALAFDARAIALRGLNARLNFDPGTSEPVWGKRLRELSDLPERDG